MLSINANLRIVLVNTSHPGNIGAAARAMKTMGLGRLYLVAPEQYPCAEATARASGADDVLAAATVCETLDDAVADCSLVIGTSARDRRLEWPPLSPAASAERLYNTAANEQRQVALVFGRERIGLTNEELDRCHYLVTIPSNPDYSSLNLAAAVQILSYEIRQQHLAAEPATEAVPTESAEKADPEATAAQLEGMLGHLEELLVDVNVMSREQPKQTLLRRLRRLFLRSALSETEVNILRGIFSAAQGAKLPRSKPKE